MFSKKSFSTVFLKLNDENNNNNNENEEMIVVVNASYAIA